MKAGSLGSLRTICVDIDVNKPSFSGIDSDLGSRVGFFPRRSEDPMRKRRLSDLSYDLLEVALPIIASLCALAGLLAFLVGLVTGFDVDP